ncbi:putative baseplate assembly protein [Cohnella suwonensis]|uniref:Baseplate assembly protein n=1 Tax=Cohnella suwonensis TaxID=696072 RepID=A0ABW0LS76_9BACL
MLPRIPLDDRSFDGILQEARKGIQQRFPEWTDENSHDPGITFLELFSWLSEMQQYYLSRIPERNLRKFLSLLGIAPLEAAAAEAEVSIGNVKEPVELPAGTKLQAEDQPFETVEHARLLPLAIDRIVTRTERESSDRSASNTGGNVAFYAFGKEAAADSRLYIAFDREPAVGETISLHVRLADGDAVSPSEESGRIVPSAMVAWKIYGLDGEDGMSWLPLSVVEDETVHLTYSGRISFRIDAPVRQVIVHPAADKPRFWISCTLEQAGYELPPRIDRVLLNTVKARQQDTKSEQLVYDGTGLPGQTIVSDRFLARYGELLVQVREPNGSWRDWREVRSFDEDGVDKDGHCYVVVRESGADGASEVRFGDGARGSIPAAGTRNIRRIHCEKSFAPLALVGRSNGLPHQKAILHGLPCKWRDGLALQVGVPGEDDMDVLWEDWEPVADFDRSGPLDRHYVYEPETGVITFGNDENGAIPVASEELNFRLIGCVLGGGVRGNIKPHLLTEWRQDEQRALGLTSDNAGYGSGGAEEESLEACLERAQAEWQTPYCAVTSEDYARLAMETPGLKVTRVHVIPNRSPGREKPAPGAVTVVVVPEGLGETPAPSAGFLATVAKHLDDRRLVTTEVHVVAPEYVKVTVHAVVVVEPQFMDESRRIAAALNRLLTPTDGADGVRGWPFGRTVHKGDIYGAISRIKGVAYVQDLWMDAEGRAVKKSPGGDILLEGHGIVYSGDHRIELISRAQL